MDSSCIIHVSWNMSGARIDASAEMLHHMNHDEAVSTALQLEHDAGLMTTNLQVLSQFVTWLNRVSSDVIWLAFGSTQCRLCRHLLVLAGQPTT